MKLDDALQKEAAPTTFIAAGMVLRRIAGGSTKYNGCYYLVVPTPEGLRLFNFNSNHMVSNSSPFGSGSITEFTNVTDKVHLTFRNI